MLDALCGHLGIQPMQQAEKRDENLALHCNPEEHPAQKKCPQAGVAPASVPGASQERQDNDDPPDSARSDVGSCPAQKPFQRGLHEPVDQVFSWTSSNVYVLDTAQEVVYVKDASTQVDLMDVEEAVIWFGDNTFDPTVDTHRSFDIRRGDSQVLDISLDVTAAPPPEEGMGFVDKIDSEIRKALEGAKLFGEWIPTLWSGGMEMPGPIQQVTENYLRSAECTPAATPRPIKGSAHQQGMACDRGSAKDQRPGGRENESCTVTTTNAAHRDVGVHGRSTHSSIFSSLFWGNADSEGASVAVAGEKKLQQRDEEEELSTSSAKASSLSISACTKETNDEIMSKVATMIHRGCSEYKHPCIQFLFSLRSC